MMNYKQYIEFLSDRDWNFDIDLADLDPKLKQTLRSAQGKHDPHFFQWNCYAPKNCQCFTTDQFGFLLAVPRRSVMTADKYQAALKKHDWDFEFADDGAAYRAGLEVLKALRAAQPIHDPKNKLWNQHASQYYRRLPALDEFYAHCNQKLEAA